MLISVRLFASVREAVGSNSVTLDLPEGATVSTLTAEMLARYPQVRVLTEARVSVNFEYVAGDHPIREGDDLAVIPPVSGGQ